MNNPERKGLFTAPLRRPKHPAPTQSAPQPQKSPGGFNDGLGQALREERAAAGYELGHNLAKALLSPMKATGIETNSTKDDKATPVAGSSTLDKDKPGRPRDTTAVKLGKGVLKTVFRLAGIAISERRKRNRLPRRASSGDNGSKQSNIIIEGKWKDPK